MEKQKKIKKQFGGIFISLWWKAPTYLFLCVVCSRLNADDYIPVTTWAGPTPAEKQTIPAYYKEVTDPVFKTRFKRVTKNGDRGYYSLRPVFNRDSTKFLLNSGKIRKVKDGSLIGDLYTLSGKQSFRNPIWSKVDPDIIFGTIALKFVSLNISNGNIKIIRNLAVKDGFVSNDNTVYMDNKQSIGGDDEYIVLSDVTRGGKTVVVLNIQTGDRYAWIKNIDQLPNFKVRQDTGDHNRRMNAGVSLLKKYVVLGAEDGDHLFDLSLNYIRKLAKHGHADFGIDNEGNEVYVSTGPAKYEVLTTGEIYDLLGSDSYAGGHLNASANYKQPGWAYFSINADSNDKGANGNTQGYEIVGVKLDKTGINVRKIVHPHNTGDSNSTSSYAVPNPEGTMIMFNSSWDNAGPVNAYIVNLTLPTEQLKRNFGNKAHEIKENIK